MKQFYNTNKKWIYDLNTIIKVMNNLLLTKHMEGKFEVAKNTIGNSD